MIMVNLYFFLNQVRVKVNNKSGQVYTIVATIRINTTLYTGKIHRLVKKEIKEARISPQSEQELITEVNYDDYEKHLIDQNSFGIVVVARVIENDYHYSARDEFRLRMPDISIDVRKIKHLFTTINILFFF